MTFAFILALVLGMPAGQAGTEGSIQGVVTDPQGAVVPGVVVQARNTQTSAVFRCATNNSGAYLFLVVPAGTYDISAEHPGFKPFLQTGVPVAVGARVGLPIRLDVGTREEDVTVSGHVPLVETTRTAFSSTVDRRSIESLPLNGRNFLNFTLLTPAINSGTLGFLSVGGQMPMNSLIIDGIDHNGFGAGVVGSAEANKYLFSQEAIQEFRVNTSSYSAEFGRAGTAVINVVTKSGSNHLRGSTFWYYRDRALNAKGYIEKLKGEPKAPFHANQFGGTAGGPAIEDRLFFYGSYDGQRRSEWNRVGSTLLSTFTPVTDYQERALDYLRARAGSFQRTFNQNVILGKLDWRISGRHSLTTQWNRHRLQAPNFAAYGPVQSLEHTGSDGQVADTVASSLTSVLSSTAVNIARVSYVSTHTPQDGNSSNPEATVKEGTETVLMIGRLSRLQDNGIRRAELSDTLSFSRGNHAPKIGGALFVERGRFFSAVNFFGTYQFNSLESFGHSLAGDSAGVRYVQAFSGEGKPPIDVRPGSVELAAFAQDAWRVRPRLTLDLGVRYEVQVMEQSPVWNPSPALAAAGIDTRFIPTDSNNIAPRVGFAWTPTAGDRLVVRGGYGLFFSRSLLATAARAFFENGITTQTRTFPAAQIPVHYPNTICGPPDLSGGPPNCPAPPLGADIIMAIPWTYQQPAVEQGSIGAEYSLRKDLAVSLTYLRVKGVHLTHWQDINLPDPTMGTIRVADSDEVFTYRYYKLSGQKRPMADFDRVLLLNTNGTSSYHGLAVQVNKRWSRDFQLLASYTLSKVVDDNPTVGTLNPGSAGDSQMLSDSRDANLDRALGDADQRHRFVLSGIWDLTYASGLPQPARALLSGWTMSGIVTAGSGRRYSALVSGDLNNDGNNATDRPPGVGRNTFSLPAVVSVDARLTRNFRVNRRVRLQVSWDAFNLLNRANLSAVKTAQYALSREADKCHSAPIPCLILPQSAEERFGTPTQALDPRMMQLSVRFTF